MMLAFPDTPDEGSLIDWAEMSCLFSPNGRLSRSQVEGVLGDNLVAQPEQIADGIWARIERRGRQCGNYPIANDRHELTRRTPWVDPPAYTFQLVLSRHRLFPATTLGGKEFLEPSYTFEEVTAAALRSYLSGETCSVHALRRPPSSMRFLDVVRHAAQEMNEELRDVKGALVNVFKRKQDMGADVLAFRNMGDARSGKVILMAQCAAGTNWRKARKGRDLAPGLWNNLINWPAKPLLALAIPFVVEEEGEWLEESHAIGCNGGMLLDRLRIATLCGPASLGPSLGKAINDFCEAQIAHMPFDS